MEHVDVGCGSAVQFVLEDVLHCLLDCDSQLVWVHFLIEEQMLRYCSCCDLCFI